MAGPTRISQLTDGAPVQETDQIPVARGSGASGYTYKVNAGRLVSDLLNVTNSPSVNLSFDSSTRTLSADVVSTVDASVNVVDSPTIDLDWNASTRTLSANANYLLTLINTLSTNMQNIGNYPYLEYAWVTAPNAASQTFVADTITTLTINTEKVDTGNYGSLSNNQITLQPGTYIYEGHVHYWSSPADATMILGLYDITSNRYIQVSGPSYSNGSSSGRCEIKGQFTINSSNTFEIRGARAGGNGGVYNGTSTQAFDGISTADADQRTTLKLWKVG